MEHIRQSSQKHASGTFDITKYSTSLRPMIHLISVFTFPVHDNIKKFIAIGLAGDRGYLEKNGSQFPGIACLGKCPAPGQSLPLNMDETTLDGNIRPELVQYTNHLWIAIYGKASRAKPFAHEALKEGHQLGNGALGNRVLIGHNIMRIGVHQSNETLWAVQKSTVQKKMLAVSQARPSLWWCLFQIVVNHTVQLCWTMLALAGKLSNGIPFNNPASEPLPLFGAPCRRIMPARRLLAGWTKPALLPIKIVSISLQNS